MLRWRGLVLLASILALSYMVTLSWLQCITTRLLMSLMLQLELKLSQLSMQIWMDWLQQLNKLRTRLVQYSNLS